MADKNVDIKFRTKADSRGAKEAKKGIDDVGRSAKNSERALDRTEETARDLREELKRQKGIDPKVRKQFEKLADEMDRAAMMGRKMASSQQANAKSSRNSGLAVLEFSRAVEDAQYGVRGILNNIPQLVLLMGGGGGLAGVVSLAAVGLTQLFSALSDNEETLEDTTDAVDDLVTKLADLRKETFESNFASFIDSLDQVRDRISLQNTEFRENIKLLQHQRTVALSVAAAQDDLERARIARRVATDPEYTEQQAEIDRSTLDLRRIERERQAKIEAETQRVLAAEQKEADIKEENVLFGEELSELLRLKVDREKRIAALEKRELQAKVKDLEIAALQEKLDDAGLLDTAATGLENAFRFLPVTQLGEALSGVDTEARSTIDRDEVAGRLGDAKGERAVLFGPGAEAELQALRDDLEAIKSNIETTDEQLKDSNLKLKQARVESSTIREAAEDSINATNQISEAQAETELIQTELKTTLRESTQVFKRSVLPELANALKESEIVHDEGTKKIIAGIHEMANNQVSDLDEKDRLFASFRALQSRGFEQTGALMSLTEQSLNELRSLDVRMRALETKVKQVGGRQ